MKRYLVPALTVLALVAVAGTALAAGVVVGDEVSILDLLRPVLEAFRGKDYDAAGALALVVLTTVLIRYGTRLPGKLGAFFAGEFGKLVLLVGGAFFASLGAQVTGDAGLSLGVLRTAAWLAFLAGGGYAMAKKFAYPLLVKLRGKLPGWAQAILDVVLWVLDGGKAAAVAKAERAGAAAVAAAPGKGIAGVVGEPRDVE